MATSTADQGSTGAGDFRDLTAVRPGAVAGDRARAVFGQVMGLAAVTVGFAALGAYLGRNLSGGTGILLFIVGFACIFGLQFATARGHEQLAVPIRGPGHASRRSIWGQDPIQNDPQSADLRDERSWTIVATASCTSYTSASRTTSTSLMPA